MIKLFLPFLCLLIISCGHQGQSNLKVSIGAVTGSAQFPGGLVIMGQNQTTGQFFSKKVPNSDSFEFEVDNGNWNFVTMGWDSSSFIFEGTPYCDVKEGIKIDGDDFFLELVATSAKCSHSVFGKHTVNNFNNLMIKTCMGIDKKIASSNLTDPSLACDGSQDFIVSGGRGSVRLTMFDFDTAIGADQSRVLVSKCYNFSGSSVSSNIKLPFWNNETPFPLKVEAFNDPSCSTGNGLKTVLLQKGLSEKSLQNQAQALHDNSSIYKSLFLNTNKCTPSQEIDSPFGNGSPAANNARLLCNATHWGSINSDLPANGNAAYVLGDDIDFGGSNTTVSNTMNDYFIGRGFTISDGDSPLFNLIQTGIQESYIRDFNIDNYNVNLGTDITNNAGILANTLKTNNNSLSFITVSNIEITNSSISGSSTTDWSAYSIGGLIGYIDSNSSVASDEKITIKNNKSFADISISSTNISGAVGGLIGYAHGPTAISDNGIEIIGNKVGLEAIVDDPSLNRVQLQSLNSTGDTRLGGILGKAKYLTEFRLNMSSTDLDGRSKIGGLIGNIFDNVKIDNNFSDTIFNSTNPNPSKIGGVVGNVSGGSADRFILNGYSRLYINDNDTGSLVGGIIGEAISLTNSDDLQIKNYKSVIDIAMDGDKFGGVFGEFSSTSGSLGEHTVQDIVVEGFIKDPSSAPSSEDRGGIAGISKFISAKRVIVDILIEGDNHIAGLIGDSTEDKVSEVYANVDLTAYGSSAIYLGGLVGKMNVSSTSLYSYIKVDGLITSTNAGVDCSNPTDYCGKLVGQTASGVAPGWSNIIVSASLSDTGGLDTNECNGLCSGSEIAELFTSDLTCSTLNASSFSNIDGSCKLLTEQFWRESGYGFSELEQKNTYLAGNAIEPFWIDNINKWNLIKDKEVLLSKSFKLSNHLDFGSSSPEPIGTSSLPFTGLIIPNDFELRNISMTSNVSPYGLFSNASEKAKIGLRQDPLIINDFYINCLHFGCGIIGWSNESNISIQVSKGHIDASLSGHIGLVGYAVGDTHISHSSFEGKIIGVSSDYIGGLVGLSSNSADLYISNSFVKFSKLVGEDYIGGLIGFKSDTGGEEISITDSYVWFDKDNQNSGDDIDITSSFAGGISGGFSNGGGTYNFNRVYVDFDNASFSANASSQFQNLIHGTINTLAVGNSGYVGSGINDGAEMGEVFNSTQVGLASSLMFETEQVSSPWYETQDGRIVLRWERLNK